MFSNICDKIPVPLWWVADDHSVWLMYAWDLITAKLENATQNTKSWKRLSCISHKIERCHLFWLYLPFLRDMLWKLLLWKLFLQIELCKEGKHDSLGCNESGKELIKMNCSVYEQNQFCILTEVELRSRKKAHMSFGS